VRPACLRRVQHFSSGRNTPLEVARGARRANELRIVTRLQALEKCQGYRQDQRLVVVTNRYFSAWQALEHLHDSSLGARRQFMPICKNGPRQADGIPFAHISSACLQDAALIGWSRLQRMAQRAPDCLDFLASIPFSRDSEPVLEGTLLHTSPTPDHTDLRSRGATVVHAPHQGGGRTRCCAPSGRRPPPMARTSTRRAGGSSPGAWQATASVRV
jgi:hypothetical protein